jgi:BirA family transcriptional regulator, biotin operon repressor / biotin---[acetyl-CoA-carboxylase] ligase
VDLREWHEELPSTQDRAINLARTGAPVGTRVVAGRQSRGRGRAGHEWHSPAGGLYLSVVLPYPPGRAALLPLAIGAQLADVFAHRWSVQARLKWPNDLYVAAPTGHPRKLSGIVVDVVESPAGSRAVAGIGVNVVVPPGGFPPEIGVRPVALEEIVEPCPSVREVEDASAGAATQGADALRRPETERAVVARCRELLYGVGRSARLDGVPAGTIRDLADDGALVLSRDGESVPVRSGELSVEAA